MKLLLIFWPPLNGKKNLSRVSTRILWIESFFAHWIPRRNWNSLKCSWTKQNTIFFSKYDRFESSTWNRRLILDKHYQQFFFRMIKMLVIICFWFHKNVSKGRKSIRSILQGNHLRLNSQNLCTFHIRVLNSYFLFFFISLQICEGVFHNLVIVNGPNKWPKTVECLIFGLSDWSVDLYNVHRSD